uniref:Spherulin n=1 Tax=Astrosclera willeyana TaxID=85810 RepID=H6TI88_9METZ|nr:spherulin [Astrosclera willeyana]
MNRAIQIAGLLFIQLVSLSSAAVQLRVGIYNCIPDIGQDNLTSYKGLIEGGFNNAAHTVDAVVDTTEYDPYGDLTTYLSEDGFDMIEMDTANLKEVVEDDLIIDIPTNLPENIMPAAVGAAAINGKLYAYPTLLCGNFLIGLVPPGNEQNCPLRNARVDYNAFYETMENCKQNVGGDWRRILGGKMNDDYGWYLPYLYLDGYIDIHGRESVDKAVDEVMRGVVDPKVCERLSWYIGCCDDKTGQVGNKCYENFIGSYVNDSDNLYPDIINGETAFYFGFSEKVAQVERDSDRNSYAAISGPLGEINNLLQFTDALVINKARWNAANDEKRNAIIDFVNYFLNNNLREDIAMGVDLNPPQVRYLLQSTETFYQNTTDLIYQDLFWSLQRAVAAPSLTSYQKVTMEANLESLCIKFPQSKKMRKFKQEL